MPTNPTPIYERGTPAPLREYIRRKIRDLVNADTHRAMIGDPARFRPRGLELSDAAADRLLAALRTLDTEDAPPSSATPAHDTNRKPNHDA
jgi:hypothetical protein